MSEKKWVAIEFDDCPTCGDAVEILTDSDDENRFYDGDDVRCVSCGEKGYFSAGFEDWAGYISWDED